MWLIIRKTFSELFFYVFTVANQNRDASHTMFSCANKSLQNFSKRTAFVFKICQKIWRKTKVFKIKFRQKPVPPFHLKIMFTLVICTRNRSQSDVQIIHTTNYSNETSERNLFEKMMENICQHQSNHRLLSSSCRKFRKI
jgi:hypothetical protein